MGSGPAGMYAVGHLLEQADFQVFIDVYDRLPTPWGLIRAGVAPDHPGKKQIADRLFHFYLKDKRVRFFGNVTIGEDITHDALRVAYHAVIYAVGADDDNPLAIPGEQLSGSWSARQFVAWYNGHPDYRHLHFDLSGRRAVIIGTGNVALDVARILLLSPTELAKTDIADHALRALRASRIDEVVLLGRRGCQQSAFHNPELEELLELAEVDISVEADDLVTPGQAECSWETRRKLATLMRLRDRPRRRGRKRIVLRFQTVPNAVLGVKRVEALEIGRADRPDGSEVLPCDMLLRAIGYRGRPFPGLPFDAGAGVIANVAGRVGDAENRMTGVYVTGWIKRGARGVIGSNKQCAAETVAGLLSDAAAGILTQPSTDVPLGLRRTVSYRGWQRIDLAERVAGAQQGRPRVKNTSIADCLRLAESDLCGVSG